MKWKSKGMQLGKGYLRPISVEDHCKELKIVTKNVAGHFWTLGNQLTFTAVAVSYDYITMIRNFFYQI